MAINNDNYNQNPQNYGEDSEGYENEQGVLDEYNQSNNQYYQQGTQGDYQGYDSNDMYQDPNAVLMPEQDYFATDNNVQPQPQPTTNTYEDIAKRVVANNRFDNPEPIENRNIQPPQQESYREPSRYGITGRGRRITFDFEMDSELRNIMTSGPLFDMNWGANIVGAANNVPVIESPGNNGSGSKKRWILLLTVGIFILIIGALIVWQLMSGGNDSSDYPVSSMTIDIDSVPPLELSPMSSSNGGVIPNVPSNLDANALSLAPTVQDTQSQNNNTNDSTQADLEELPPLSSNSMYQYAPVAYRPASPGVSSSIPVTQQPVPSGLRPNSSQINVAPAPGTMNNQQPALAPATQNDSGFVRAGYAPQPTTPQAPAAVAQPQVDNSLQPSYADSVPDYSYVPVRQRAYTAVNP